MLVLQTVIACAFVLVCPCTFYMAPVPAHDAVHPYLSVHIIREPTFAICTNDIFCLINIFLRSQRLWHLLILESLFTFFDASLFLLFARLKQFSFFSTFFGFSLIRRTRYRFSRTSWPFSAWSFVSQNRYGRYISRQYKVCWRIFCEVEGLEYEVVLRAELLATSDLKAQIHAVFVADSFRDIIVPVQGLCSSVAASKSRFSKFFVFKGCRPVAP
jgi:hypothetical protein